MKITEIEKEISNLQQITPDLFTTPKEDIDKKINQKETELAKNNFALNKIKSDIKKIQETLTKLSTIFFEEAQEEAQKEAQDRSNTILSDAKQELEKRKQDFEKSIK